MPVTLNINGVQMPGPVQVVVDSATTQVARMAHSSSTRRYAPMRMSVYGAPRRLFLMELLWDGLLESEKPIIETAFDAALLDYVPFSFSGGLDVVASMSEQINFVTIAPDTDLTATWLQEGPFYQAVSADSQMRMYEMSMSLYGVAAKI